MCVKTGCKTNKHNNHWSFINAFRLTVSQTLLFFLKVAFWMAWRGCRHKPGFPPNPAIQWRCHSFSGDPLCVMLQLSRTQWTTQPIVTQWILRCEALPAASCRVSTQCRWWNNWLGHLWGELICTLKVTLHISTHGMSQKCWKNCCINQNTIFPPPYKSKTSTEGQRGGLHGEEQEKKKVSDRRIFFKKQPHLSRLRVTWDRVSFLPPWQQ